MVYNLIMKFLFVISFFTLVSCDAVIFFGDNSSEIINMGNKETALESISHNIKYDFDKNIEFWQKPTETIGVGSGICIDSAILALSAMTAINEPCKLVWLKKGDMGHACIRIDGKLFDQQANRFMDYESDGWRIVGEYSFTDAMKLLSMHRIK